MGESSALRWDVGEREDTASERTPMQWHKTDLDLEQKSTVLRFEDGARRLGIDDLARVS